MAALSPFALTTIFTLHSLLQGGARRGPTLRECVLVHAVARLALWPHINNIQVGRVLVLPYPCMPTTSLKINYKNKQ